MVQSFLDLIRFLSIAPATVLRKKEKCWPRDQLISLPIEQWHFCSGEHIKYWSISPICRIQMSACTLSPGFRSQFKLSQEERLPFAWIKGLVPLKKQCGVLLDTRSHDIQKEKSVLKLKAFAHKSRFVKTRDQINSHCQSVKLLDWKNMQM